MRINTGILSTCKVVLITGLSESNMKLDMKYPFDLTITPYMFSCNQYSLHVAIVCVSEIINAFSKLPNLQDSSLALGLMAKSTLMGFWLKRQIMIFRL